MKTLQIVGNSAYGGATYLIIEWCRYLLDKGWCVDVLCTDQQTIEKLQRIPNICVISNIFIPREISPRIDFVAFSKTLKLVRQKKYEVVHTYTATPGVIGRLAAWFSGIKKIYHHQAGWTMGLNSSIVINSFYKKVEWFLASISTASICVGFGVAEEARQGRYIPSKKIYIIKNGINPLPFSRPVNLDKQKILSKYSIPVDSFVIISTSRLSKQKDISTLINAISIYKHKNEDKNICLLLVGDGPERNELEKLVINLNLKNDVLFLGYCENIPSLLHSADVFVSTTLREGLSISILEAMACGKPVITTDIVANKELIENDITGLLIPTLSPAKLAEAIEKFRNNPELASNCGKLAREKVLHEYTLDRMFEETYKLYRTR